MKKCEICDKDGWLIVHNGQIRIDHDYNQSAVIGQCEGCGVQRLEEKFCLPESAYQGPEYRESLKEGVTSEDFYQKHDAEQLFHLGLVGNVRDKVIADIGCGAGSFLDHVSGLTDFCTAIEPCDEYFNNLADTTNYHVYRNTKEALVFHKNKMDIAVCFSTIEHVLNPRELLEDIGKMLKPGGKLIVTTPNRNNVLMSLDPEHYSSCFYRTQHRWYFDLNSLSLCGKLAGLSLEEIGTHCKYGLDNAMIWMRDKKFGGEISLPPGKALNNSWKTAMESWDMGDTLCAVFTK